MLTFFFFRFRDQTAQKVQSVGEEYGDMFEVSTMRKEDYDFIKDASGEFVDVLQCNNAASSRTPRGHQFPGAFMEVVSDFIFRSFNPALSSSWEIAVCILSIEIT